jgi:hypothetical protein
MAGWRCVKLLLAFVIVAVAVPAALFAAVTQIAIKPGVPIVVGSSRTFQVVSSKPVSQYKIRWRCLEQPTGLWSDPFSNGTGIFGPFNEPRVGNREVEGQTIAFIGMPPQPVTSTLTRQYTVVGPDSDVIVQGLNTNSTGFPRMENEVRFIMKYSDIWVRGWIDGFPQERIRRPQKPPPNDDSGWVGPKPGEFDWATEYFFDLKFVHLPNPQSIAHWNSLPVNTVFDDFFQQNRFVIRNCNGAFVYYYFEERRFQKVKSGAQTWTLVQINP